MLKPGVSLSKHPRAGGGAIAQEQSTERPRLSSQHCQEGLEKSPARNHGETMLTKDLVQDRAVLYVLRCKPILFGFSSFLRDRQLVRKKQPRLGDLGEKVEDSKMFISLCCGQ